MRRVAGALAADEPDEGLATDLGMLPGPRIRESKTPLGEANVERRRYGKYRYMRERPFSGRGAPELLLLAGLFLLALTFGYWGSAKLWLVQLSGAWPTGVVERQQPTAAGTDWFIPLRLSCPAAPASAPADPQTDVPDRAHSQPNESAAAEPEEPPSLLRRETYLAYFRPLAFDTARVERHGGPREAELEAAKSMVVLTQSRIVSQGSNNVDTSADEATVLDELWQEETFRGVAWGAATRTRDETTSGQIDAMIATLQRDLYEARNPSSSWLGFRPSQFAFKMEDFGSRGLKEGWGRCPALEGSLGKPMDTRRNALFILGAQKGGTTFLYNALTKHSSFIGADHAYQQAKGPWAKELHFFNRWPLPDSPKREFLKCFPKKTWSVGETRQPFTLVDATPDYLFNAMAAPRIKAMWPQAKFVVLLRDPVARAYSAWKMSRRMACRIQAREFPSSPCHFPSFAEAMLNELRTLQAGGCAFDRKDQLVQKTWSSCHGCKVTFVDGGVCKSRHMYKQPCSAGPFLTLAVSTYAPQLAWWFSHFPPDRFKIVRSHDLHHGSRVDVLNDILRFTQLDAPEFTQKSLVNVWGYDGGYKASDLDESERKVVRLLRLFFRQAEEDLEHLLAVTHPNVETIPDEFDL